MLYRRPDSRKWWVRVTTASGKKISRSTGTEDKEEAEAYEAKLKQEIWKQKQMGEKPKRTWKEAVVRWVTETSHKASHDDDLMHLRWVDKHLSSLTLDQINRDVLYALAERRKADGVSNATVNRMLSVVHSILRKAEKNWEWLDRAYVIPLLPEPKKRIRWLTHEEADRLIAELPEHLADMVRFTLATGLREKNVTHLEWSQVDLSRKVAWVHHDQSKSGKAINVPLSDDAIEIIERWKGRNERFVFCFLRSTKEGVKRWVPVEKANRSAWRKALKRAQIEDFRWHDLRHTWASWHVQSGTPLYVLKELGGWSDLEMVMRYSHLAVSHLAEYAGNVSSKKQQQSDGEAEKAK